MLILTGKLSFWLVVISILVLFLLLLLSKLKIASHHLIILSLTIKLIRFLISLLHKSRLLN